MATVTQATEESIKLWLKVGNLKKLEQAVLDGYGNQLRGRNSRIPKINKFLKRVPHYQAKITAIHTAAAQGNVRDLENLLDRKGLVFSRDSLGATVLHIAVQQKQENVVQYLLRDFPSLVHARDHYGRSALHYEAAFQVSGEIQQMLINAGADPQLKDMAGKTAADYADKPEDFQLQPKPDVISAIVSRRQSREVSSMLRQPSPIIPMTKTEVRAIIQKGDIMKLERAILHGYGERLLGEPATSTRVKDLLESIPQHLSKLAAFQTAIENGSLREVQNQLNRKSLVIARDSQGLTILHKAVLHGQKDIVEYLISINPKGIFAKDHDKRTPVHYAAVLEDDGEMYNTLMKAGGNPSLPDCNGKTPEYYRQNPGALDLKKVLERRSEGSGKLSNSNSNEYQPKTTTKSGKREITSSSQQPNGGSNSVIKQWLRSGDIEKLEKAVIDGHGLRIIRETTADPKARAFLKTLPVHMAKITSIHEAVCNGEVRSLKVLLDRRKLMLSRDKLGLGLLHKAVLFGHENIVKFIVENYPETCAVKDKLGRTALHYAAASASKDDGKLYEIILEGGADPNTQDVKGNSALHYKSNPEELDLDEVVNQINRQRIRQNVAGKQNNPVKQPETSFHITGGNIRKWIHAEDIKKLERVVLEGQGYKLLLETSNNPRVKQFLVSVPSLVKKIRDVHNAAVLGDVQGVESTIEKPELLLSKDELGMTALHKATLLEEAEIIELIIRIMPTSLQVTDEEGRTALHYAAGLKDEGSTFEMLTGLGADKDVVDNKGKSADHYLKHPGELDMRQLHANIQRNKINAQGKQETQNNDNHNNHQTINGNNVKRQVAGANLRPVRKAVSAVNNETIARLIQQGDMEKLEQVVLDGQGKRLIGKSSWNEDIRAFLKKVPQYMDKIYAVHTAAATGDLLVLQKLLDTKKIVTSKDEYGLTALHKAVKYGQTDIVKYLLQTFPASHLAKDQDGRTPLHYAAMYKDREDIYQILVNNGADAKVQDQRGKSPGRYLGKQNKLEAPIPPKPLEKIQQEGAEDAMAEDDSLSSEEEKQIETWIARGELEPLERLLLGGRGDKLLGKSSSDKKTQEFLESVPAEMGKIRAIHNAAANGELRDIHALIDKEVLATSVDEYGACPLHRAVLHGHKDVMKFLANNYPACLNIQDKSGLTPLHYAALSGSDGLLYRQLSNCGADPNVKDKSGITPGQMLRGKIHITVDELHKRYEEKKVPPRPHSVQTWERPPTEELLRALTPSPMTSTTKQAEMPDKSSIDGPEEDKPAEDSENINTVDQLNISSPEVEILEVAADQDENDVSQDSKDISSELVDANDVSEEATQEKAENSTIEETAENIQDSDIDDAKADATNSSNNSRRQSSISSDENEDRNASKQENEEQGDTLQEAIGEETDNNEPENVEENNETEEEEGLEQVPEETEEEIEENKLEAEGESNKQTANDQQDNAAEIVEANGEDNESANDVITVAEDGESLKDATIAKDGDPLQPAALKEDSESVKDIAIAEDDESVKDTDIAEDSKSVKAVDAVADGNQSANEDAAISQSQDRIDSPEPQENQLEAGQSNEYENEINKTVESVTDNETKSDNNASKEISNEFNKNDEQDSNIDQETIAGSNAGRESGVVIDSEEGSLTSPDLPRENQETSPGDENSNSEQQESICNKGEDLVDNNIITAAVNPKMWTKEGEYLTTVLGDALINALAEVSRMRPENPITYLSCLLYRYLQMNDAKNESTNDGITKNSLKNGVSGAISKCRLILDEDGIVDVKKLCEMKDEQGSTIVHYVAKLAHNNDGLFELLSETGYNLAERDGNYRTIRDIANEKDMSDNVDSIDRYVFSLVRSGNDSILRTMMLDGYDHILDILDDEGNDTIMVAELNHQLTTVQMLKEYQPFQEKLELLHEAVRNNNREEVSSLLKENADLGMAKNTKGQTALHLAVLNENEDLVELIANECPLAINITDNMRRTPLHYAMGTRSPELFAKIIVQKGGNQLMRDTTKHTPSYYFINNQDIQKLKDEMEQTTV